MRTLVAGFASAFVLTCGVAHAQSVAPAGLANYCTAEGAFGERFGATSLNAQATARIMNSRTIPVADAYAPFREAEVTFTHLTQRVHTITAIARYADEVEAAEAAVDFEEALDPHFPHSGLNEMEDGTAFYSSDPETVSGYKVEIVQFGREVQFVCTDRALFQQTMDEVLGRARITERPTPPQLSLPATPPVSTCATAETRAAFMTEFQGRMDSAMNYATESGRYLETLTRWKSQEMIDSGVWTEADSQAFALSMLEDPGFGRRMEATMGSAMQMISALMPAFDETASEEARCRSAISALVSARELITNGEEHWNYTIGLYDAEARRRSAQ